MLADRGVVSDFRGLPFRARSKYASIHANTSSIVSAHELNDEV